jgi:lipoate-protein ligase A
VFANAFASRLELTVIPGDLTPEETARAIQLEREKYSTDAWNHMR